MVIISAASIVYNERFYLPMLLEGTNEWCDEHVIIDGFSTDGTWEYLQEQAKKNPKLKIAQHAGANGATPDAHNFGDAWQAAYAMCIGDWIFRIDADEALQDNARIMLEAATQQGIDVYEVRYEHFIENFSKVDAAEPIHMGAFRFHKNFPGKISMDHKRNHCIPKSDEFKIMGRLFYPIIFHCGYLNGMPKIFERYERNVKHSVIHDTLYSQMWREWHYCGRYPTKPFIEIENPANMVIKIPRAIKNRFHIGYLRDVTFLNNEGKVVVKGEI